MYTINMIGDKYFMIAGGGGAAKTGITNSMVFSVNMFSDCKVMFASQ